MNEKLTDRAHQPWEDSSHVPPLSGKKAKLTTYLFDVKEAAKANFLTSLQLLIATAENQTLANFLAESRTLDVSAALNNMEMGQTRSDQPQTYSFLVRNQRIWCV